jgi:immune inhibitor A
MKVDLQSSDSTSATVTLSSSSEASDLSVSFSHSANDLVVTFTSSPVGGDSQYSYAWDFDDNSTSNIQNPNHTFTQAGTYSVELTVMDSTGLSVKTTRSITVSKAPAVVVTAPAKVKTSGGGAISFGLLLSLCLLRIIRK